jgi:isoleucyl-tRNA synthetase
LLLGSLADFDPSQALPHADMPELERAVLHRVAEIDAEVREKYAAYDFQGVWTTVFTFATVNLSAYYFDVRKDALYCDAADSTRRRAALTVLDQLFHRIVTWLAPILVFTMEEAWLERFPGEMSSVHLQDMPETPAEWMDAELWTRAEMLREVRRVVTGALELERQAGRIGASLEAAPHVYVTPEQAAMIGDRAAFADLCITSDIRISTEPAPDEAFTLSDVPGVAVVFASAEGQKCQRCWKILPDVGGHAHPGVCARCDAALG